MNIDYCTSDETWNYTIAKESWKHILDSWAIFNQIGNVLILYYKDKVVSAGWTEKENVKWIEKNVCPLIVVDKNVALNLTEQKYNELVIQLKLKIKEFNLNKKLEKIDKDFV